MKQTAAQAPLDVLARLRPWLLMAAVALLVARPLFPSASAAEFGDGASAVMFWVLLWTAWLLAAVFSGNLAVRFGFVDAAVVLLVFWQTAAALWAVVHGAPRPAMNMLWEWVGMALGFLLLRQLLDAARECRAVLAVMIALAVGLSGYAIYQRVYEYPQTLARFDADPDGELQKAGFDYPPDSPQRKLFRDRLESNLPSATFALSNSLAGLLAPWLVILIGVAASEIRKNFTKGATAGLPSSAEHASWKYTAGQASSGTLVWLILCALLIAAGLLVTRGRGGCIAAGAGIALLAAPWAWNRARRLGWITPAAAAIIMFVGFVIAISQHNLLAQAAKSFGYRLQYWQSSLLMIAEHPWLGCGPGNFQNAYTQYKLPEASEEVADPHNFLLEVWATAGTPAAVLILVVLGGFFFGVRGRGSGVGGQGGERETRGLAASAASGPVREGGREKGEGRREKGEKVESGEWRVQSEKQRPKTQAPRPKTQISKSQIPNPKSSLFILAGGGLGFILSIPLGMLSAAPPGLMAVLIGLPLAALAIAALWPWVRDGWLPPLLPALGVLVLLINLLAAGGIAMPGVAGTLWTLMAVGLCGREPKILSRGAVWSLLASSLCMAAACYLTYYRPVLDAQLNLRMAEQNPEQAAEWLQAATRSDPLAAEPWRRLAAVRYAAYRLSPSPNAFDRFREAADEFLRLNPNSASAWMMVGDWYSFISESWHRIAPDEVYQAAAEESLKAYRRVVELYPNGAIQRAKLALALYGDRPAFRREARAALQLDEITPHADKKLPPDMREQLTRLLQEEP